MFARFSALLATSIVLSSEIGLGLAGVDDLPSPTMGSELTMASLPVDLQGAPPMRDDYTVTPGAGIHKLNRRLVTWNQARKICINEGGHLAIINSLKEERALLNMLDDDVSVGYIGVHDLYEEGEWTTVLDEPLEMAGYAKWTTYYGKHEPDNAGGDQNCGVLVKAGGMDDTTCTTLHAFFCELPSMYN